MLLSDSLSTTLPDEFRLAVALGRVPGWTAFRQFGMNDAVVSGSQEMWPLGTALVWPTSAGTVSVVSDSINDDSAGTGARTVTLVGLDASYLPITETVTMDGTTPVVTTASFLRVNAAYVVTAGSGGINVGNITGSISGNPQIYIEADEGYSHSTHYTVPANKVLLVTTYINGVGRMAGSTDLHIKGQVRLQGTDTAWRTITDVYLWQNIHGNSASATLLPAKTDIRQVIDSTTSTQCFGIVGGYLVSV